MSGHTWCFSLPSDRMRLLARCVPESDADELVLLPGKDDQLHCIAQYPEVVGDAADQVLLPGCSGDQDRPGLEQVNAEEVAPTVEEQGMRPVHQVHYKGQLCDRDGAGVAAGQGEGAGVAGV